MTTIVQKSHPRRRTSSAVAGKHAELLQERLVVGFFCWSVMGIIWSWTAVIVLAYIDVFFAGVMAVYLAYAWTLGFNHAEVMGTAKLRRWGIWHLMRTYFSGELHKLADLDPQKTYIFAMLPHGITALSAWLNFATEATGFSQLFPGIQVRCATLDANFLAPGIREYCLAHGLRSAGRRSLKAILGSGPGSAVMLLPGGAAEALHAAPGTFDVLTQCRKGFVRIAIETGSCLVPVLAFGECDAFDTFIPEHGSMAEKLLRKLKKSLGIATPIFWGVGLTQGWGFLPYSVPLNTVVGVPIDVPKYKPHSRADETMAALVEEYHAKYLAAVQKMYDEHKDRFAANRKRDLHFIQMDNKDK